MSTATSIEWTDASWNPIRGCSRVSEGCRHCYAERMAFRFSGEGQPYEGLLRIDAAVDRQPQWNGRTELVPSHLLDPLRWRRPRRIFVNSMSDLFHESVPRDWLDRIFAVMACARQHTFQVLTKRPEAMRRYSREVSSRRWPLPNVMLGVSVENQEAVESRVPVLLDTPAALRFLSIEPLLGPVYLERLRELDWVIVGGESGPAARRCDLAWIEHILSQCADAGVPCFVKQLGSNPAPDFYRVDEVPEVRGAKRTKGNDMEKWPEILRVRKLPKATLHVPEVDDRASA